MSDLCHSVRVKAVSERNKVGVHVFLPHRVRMEYEAELARVEATKAKQAQIAAAKEEEALRIISETQVRKMVYFFL